MINRTIQLIHLLPAGTLKLPRSAIPSGTWTLAFAPAIFTPTNSWFLLFADRRDSEFVWFFWPARGETEGKVLELLTDLREEGRLKAEKPMKVGDGRHRLLHALVEQAVWTERNMGLDMKWMSGEFSSVD